MMSGTAAYCCRSVHHQVTKQLRTTYNIEGMPEDKKNVPFYEKHGFQQMEHGAAIQICNYSDKR